MLVRQVLARPRPAARRLGPTREVRRERHFFATFSKLYSKALITVDDILTAYLGAQISQYIIYIQFYADPLLRRTWLYVYSTQAENHGSPLQTLT